jgi:hypothetical protein
MVRWQTWHRMTGTRLTVTGKRREVELLIALDHARPAACGPQSGGREARYAADPHVSSGTVRLLVCAVPDHVAVVADSEAQAALWACHAIEQARRWLRSDGGR